MSILNYRILLIGVNDIRILLIGDYEIIASRSWYLLFYDCPRSQRCDCSNCIYLVFIKNYIACCDAGLRAGRAGCSIDYAHCSCAHLPWISGSLWWTDDDIGYKDDRRLDYIKFPNNNNGSYYFSFAKMFLIIYKHIFARIRKRQIHPSIYVYIL